MSAEPRNAPTHGVHPTEKMTPNSTEEKNPSWRPASGFFAPWKRLILMMPRKYSPNAMTTSPHTTLTALWYSTKNAPTDEAKAPMAMNTQAMTSLAPKLAKNGAHCR